MAWDSTSGVGMTLETLVRAPPEGHIVDVAEFSEFPAGVIFWQRVLPSIVLADVVIGVVDRPNANAGFELGIAAGQRVVHDLVDDDVGEC